MNKQERIERLKSLQAELDENIGGRLAMLNGIEYDAADAVERLTEGLQGLFQDMDAIYDEMVALGLNPTKRW